MGKTLSQITFDFAANAPAPVPATAPVPPPEEKKFIVIKEVEESATNQKKTSNRGRRSLKEIGLNADLIQVPEDDILFQKQYYS